MASGPITSWQIDGETVETVPDFIFGGFKITADGDCSHEFKRRLLLGRKVMTNLDSNIEKQRHYFAMSAKEWMLLNCGVGEDFFFFFLLYNIVLVLPCMRRRGQQRMSRLDGNTDSIDVSLSELRELVMDREAWSAAIYGVSKSRTWLEWLKWTKRDSWWGWKMKVKKLS